MKKLLGSLLLPLMVGGISSCRNELDPLDPGHNRTYLKKEKPQLKTVRLAFGGDYISESEEPLLRAEENNTYKAINVYRSENVENPTDADYVAYAYGVFKNFENIELKLHTGYKYKFEATIISDDVDKVDLSNGKFLEPFHISEWGSQNEADQLTPDDLDSFHYEIGESLKTYYLKELSDGTAYVNVGNDWPNGAGNMSYPRVNRYYGTSSGIEAIDDLTVEIPMYYKCFGLQINIQTLPFGTVKVEDQSLQGTSVKSWTQRLLFPKDLVLSKAKEGEVADESIVESWQGYFSCNNLRSDAEPERIRLVFTWIKGEGLTDKQFQRTVEVSPNKNKILNVNITGTNHESKNGNLILKIDETEMEDVVEREVNYNEI